MPGGNHAGTMISPMTVQLLGLVLDTTAPTELARFWAQALGWTIEPADGGGVDLVPTDPTTFRLLLRPSASEKIGRNPTHLDLATTSPDDQQRVVEELVAIGGRPIDIGQGPDEPHVVLADPDGNELCIIEPYNRYLASCPRLGAVNCDGTRALGSFFSQALGWPLVWDQDEETAIQAPDRTGPKIQWSGPPLRPKSNKERFHFHVAPTSGSSVDAALDHLLALGATHLDGGHGCPGAITLADVDGNELCLVEAR